MAGTGKDLVEHWTWAADKGLMNKNTASALRAACAQVLSVEDNWEGLNVNEINVEELLTRFENLRMKDFKPRSLESYKRRFRRALESYLAHLEDPGGWEPPRRKRGTTTKADHESGGAKSIASKVGLEKAGMVDYPFPLRPGTMAHLILPTDLTHEDIRRLTAFLKTVAVDYAETREG